MVELFLYCRCGLELFKYNFILFLFMLRFVFYINDKTMHFEKEWIETNTIKNNPSEFKLQFQLYLCFCCICIDYNNGLVV